MNSSTSSPPLARITRCEARFSGSVVISTYVSASAVTSSNSIASTCARVA